MPHVPLLEIEQAPQAVKTVYEEFHRRMSFPSPPQFRMLGVDRDTLDPLVEDVTMLNDPRLRDIILFAVKCSRDPQSLTDGDDETLRRHGLQQSEIVEIIGMSAFAVYANIIADATAMEPDEMFDSI